MDVKKDVMEVKKKEWSPPTLEVLDVSMTTAFGAHNPGGMIDDPYTPADLFTS